MARPTKTQVDTLQRMVDGSGNLYWVRGGYWVATTAYTTDTFGKPDVPYTPTTTVRAMESRGWVQRIWQFPEEWRDTRSITVAGIQALKETK
jgi:hypothetical protein